MSTPFELSRLNVGDILDRTITLIRATFTRVGVILLCLAVPAAILFGVVLDGFLSSILVMAASDAMPDTTMAFVGSIMKWMIILLLAAVVLMAVELTALVSMQIIVCGEIVGRHIGTREALELTAGVRLWRALAQRFLAELAVGLVIVVPYLAAIGTITFDMGAAAIITAVVIAFFAIFGAIYLKVRWAFGTTTIAWEDETILGSFGRSSDLVRGNALRTFGILALFAVIVGLLVSVLLTPVQLLMFKDIFMAGLGQARNVALQSQNEVVDALSGIGFLYGVSVALASLITTSLKSVYLPVLYFDLRARGGEFESE